MPNSDAFQYLSNLPGSMPIKAYQQRGTPMQEVERFENQVLGGLMSGTAAQVGSQGTRIPNNPTPGIKTVQQVVQGTAGAVRNSSQAMLQNAQMQRAVKIRKQKEEAERQRQMQIQIQRVGGVVSGAPGGGAGQAGNYGAPARGGTAVSRIQSILGRFPGLRITETLGNRAYDVAHGVARVPTSYHYDAANPAVDIAGPTNQLWALYYELQRMGGWRQILWQVAGHYDHLHVA